MNSPNLDSIGTLLLETIIRNYTMIIAFVSDAVIVEECQDNLDYQPWNTRQFVVE